MRFTDKQFFDWEIEHGLYPGGSNKGFYEVHQRVAKYIIDIYFPKLHLDLGGGNSPLTKILQDNGVDAHLIELNLFSCELQRQYGTKNIYNLDFCANGLTNNYDVITSIEVFEHIEDSKLLPFIADLSKRCKYFLFSSTPNYNTPEFDEQWGHVNIKPTDEWIRVFEANGFKWLAKETEYLQRMIIPTPWVLMFKSLSNA